MATTALKSVLKRTHLKSTSHVQQLYPYQPNPNINLLWANRKSSAQRRRVYSPVIGPQIGSHWRVHLLLQFPVASEEIITRIITRISFCNSNRLSVSIYLSFPFWSNFLSTRIDCNMSARQQWHNEHWQKTPAANENTDPELRAGMDPAGGRTSIPFGRAERPLDWKEAQPGKILSLLTMIPNQQLSRQIFLVQVIWNHLPV